MNFIRNKIEFLKELIVVNVDIFLISETKLNDTFPTGQFLINGYQLPLRFDRNGNGGGLLLYCRDHIPCKKLNLDFNPVIEVIAIEINLKKRKWLLIGSYNPQKDMIRNHLNSIGNVLNDLCLKYENFILIGDFNSEIDEDAMSIFCTTYNLKNLVKEPTCFKNVENPSCIDLILTNKPLHFQSTKVIESGLSDCHKFTITILTSNFVKQEPKIFNYRNYKKFNNKSFRNDLLGEISKKGFHELSCMDFETLFLITLNYHAPMKTKYIRVNNSPFMNKELSKAIMVRSRLRNKSIKLKTIESRQAYNKQRNFCVTLLRQVKKDFYENLNPALISDNKKFWKQVKPFFFDKTPSNSNIMLSEGKKIISDPTQCADIFNNFFIDSIKNLDIDRTLYTDTSINSNDPVEKAIEKFKNHPSIIRILQEGYSDNNFSFDLISDLDIQNVINKIDSSKAYQKGNIPPQIIKINADIYSMTLVYDVHK